MSGSGSNSSELNRIASASSNRSKNAPENRTDVGWKHGIDINGNGKKVKCSYCSKTVSGGIFRFKHHLAGTKEDSEPCCSVPEEIRDLMIKIVAEAKQASLKKRKLNIIDEDQGCEGLEERQHIFGSKGKEKVGSRGQFKLP